MLRNSRSNRQDNDPYQLPRRKSFSLKRIFEFGVGATVVVEMDEKLAITLGRFMSGGDPENPAIYSMAQQLISIGGSNTRVADNDQSNASGRHPIEEEADSEEFDDEEFDDEEIGDEFDEDEEFGEEEVESDKSEVPLDRQVNSADDFGDGISDSQN